MMKSVLLVFLGGGIGSVCRFLISKLINQQSLYVPLATLSVNVLGSFLIGLILGFSAKGNYLTQGQTLFLATGFCGGFTTFSTFMFENQTLLKSGQFQVFALYTILSFVLGFVAVFGGIYLAK